MTLLFMKPWTKSIIFDILFHVFSRNKTTWHSKYYNRHTMAILGVIQADLGLSRLTPKPVNHHQ